jgi:hypothetical protein
VLKIRVGQLIVGFFLNSNCDSQWEENILSSAWQMQGLSREFSHKSEFSISDIEMLSLYLKKTQEQSL